MRAVIQRVSRAKVSVKGAIRGEIGQGILVLIGFAKTDSVSQVPRMARRIPELRIFQDDAGKINRSLRDVRGGLLAVPNFTLYADCSRGNRPGFDGAMPGANAAPLFVALVEELRKTGLRVESGEFGADMEVELVNAGPVTLIVED